MKKILKTIILSSLIFSESHALQEVQDGVIDDRIKTMIYKPDSVHKYTGFFGIVTHITLEEGEAVERLILGDASGWEIQTFGNRLFFKPKTTKSSVINTNAVMMTNSANGGRIYHFELTAEKPDGLDDTRVALETKFVYPYQHKMTAGYQDLEDLDDSPSSNNAPEAIDAEIAKIFKLFDSIIEASKVNTDYALLGEERIEPIQVMDDGTFTVMKFRKGGLNELPVAMAVSSDGSESIVNFRVRGEYMIIEQVAARFTLRSGNDKVCVFNRKIPFKYKDPTKR